MKNMNKNITVDLVAGKIIITKAFQKEMTKFGSNAYMLLKQVQAENPGFVVEVKTTKPKKGYKNLTLEVMEAYIRLTGSKEKLAEFEAVKRVAAAKNSLYPSTKKWFLTNYPEFKDGSISALEIEAAKKRIEEEKAEAAKLAAGPQLVTNSAETAPEMAMASNF